MPKMWKTRDLPGVHVPGKFHQVCKKIQMFVMRSHDTRQAGVQGMKHTTYSMWHTTSSTTSSMKVKKRNKE